MQRKSAVPATVGQQLSHPVGYRSATMRPRHSRTGYGVWDLSRQVARRVQREWETIESPPWPPTLLAAPPCPLPPPPPLPNRTERRPLAA